MGLTGLPHEIVAAIKYGWIHSQAECEALGFLMTITGMAALYSLTTLSMQRAILVWQPTLFSIYGGPIIKGMIAMTWILACVIAFPPFFGFGTYVPEESGLS